MARIALVLTKTPWSDRRQFYRQGPALTAAGHQVLYVAGIPDAPISHPFDWIGLSTSERRLARRTGGLNLLSKIRRLRPDLVQLCSLELLPLGIALKITARTRVVYDCREDIASALFERRRSLPRWMRHLLFRAVRSLEAVAARRFDGLVTADPGVAELHAGMPDERKHVFYNTALLAQFPANYPRLANRTFDLAVLGSMSSTRSGTHLVLEALALLARRGLRPRLLLVGEPEGEVARILGELISRHGLSDQVHITGHVPHREVAKHLAESRIGIVPLLDYPKFHRNIACKAFEYMACGMPTIASDLPPQRLFLHDEIAVFFPCGDVQSLANRMVELIDNPARCETMGQRARKDVEERWNAEREQESFRGFYGRLLAMPVR